MSPNTNTKVERKYNYMGKCMCFLWLISQLQKAKFCHSLLSRLYYFSLFQWGIMHDLYIILYVISETTHTQEYFVSFHSFKNKQKDSFDSVKNVRKHHLDECLVSPRSFQFIRLFVDLFKCVYTYRLKLHFNIPFIL